MLACFNDSWRNGIWTKANYKLQISKYLWTQKTKRVEISQNQLTSVFTPIFEGKIKNLVCELIGCKGKAINKAWYLISNCLIIIEEGLFCLILTLIDPFLLNGCTSSKRSDFVSCLIWIKVHSLSAIIVIKIGLNQADDSTQLH